MTTDVANWQEWMRDYAAEPGYPFVARALGSLVAGEKIAAVWISGSRATRTADAHSDTDIRAYAPGWTEHEAAILRAVEEMLSTQTVSDATWATLAKTWDEQQLLEFPMMVGQYVCTAIVQNTLRIRLENGNPGLTHR